MAKEKTIREFLKLDTEVDPKLKKKPAAVPALSDTGVDDLGRRIPVVFGEGEFKYQQTSWNHDFSRHDPESSVNATSNFVDPVICSAFQIVRRYASSITASGTPSDDNYLWRLIYPRSNAGKACYNPSGKYCVKLFFAGKWRKVLVDDTIPLTASDSIAIAHSTEAFELWPLLLSKAIYSVYSQSG